MRSAIVFVAIAIAIAGCAAAAPSPQPTHPPQSTTPTAPATASAPAAATAVPSPTQAAPDLATGIREILGPAFNGSALVALDDEVVFAEGIGMADDANGIPNAPETRFRIGSITKQLTGMGILLLEEEGLVAAGDPVCDSLNDCPDGWEAVTLAHLLGHTSGIASFTDQPGFDPMRPSTPAETVAGVADLPLAFEPGTSFAYSNTGYVLLGMVIERASGLDYETFVRQRIFEPLDMADSGYEHGDTPGLAVGYATGFEVAEPLDMSVPYAAGGLYSTVLDMERWSAALGAGTLADPEAMERFLTPLAETTDRWPLGYAYGVYVGEEDGRRLVAHDGGINGFYTYLARYPDDNLTIVLLTNRESGPDLPVFASRVAGLVLETP